MRLKDENVARQIITSENITDFNNFCKKIRVVECETSLEREVILSPKTGKVVLRRKDQ